MYLDSHTEALMDAAEDADRAAAERAYERQWRRRFEEIEWACGTLSDDGQESPTGEWCGVCGLPATHFQPRLVHMVEAEATGTGASYFWEVRHPGLRLAVCWVCAEVSRMRAHARSGTAQPYAQWAAQWESDDFQDALVAGALTPAVLEELGESGRLAVSVMACSQGGCVAEAESAISTGHPGDWHSEGACALHQDALLAEARRAWRAQRWPRRDHRPAVVGVPRRRNIDYF